MSLNTRNTIAELRNELDSKRNRAKELQSKTTVTDEWKNLNNIRWELEDLDNDIYKSQFIKNNQKISTLINQINNAQDDAKKIIKTIDEINSAIKSARSKLKNTSKMLTELNNFYNETEELISLIS